MKSGFKITADSSVRLLTLCDLVGLNVVPIFLQIHRDFA